MERKPIAIRERGLNFTGESSFTYGRSTAFYLPRKSFLIGCKQVSEFHLRRGRVWIQTRKGHVMTPWALSSRSQGKSWSWLPQRSKTKGTGQKFGGQSRRVVREERNKGAGMPGRGGASVWRAFRKDFLLPNPPRAKCLFETFGVVGSGSILHLAGLHPGTFLHIA